MNKPLDRKNATINTIITSLTLQKSQLEAQLFKLKEVIQKKQQSIQTIETYSGEYKHHFYNTPLHSVPSYRNSQQFIDRLSSVLSNEKDELKRIESQITELLTRYHTLNQKIDGLSDILRLNRQARQAAFEKTEDTHRTELATLRTCQQPMEKNE